MHRALVLTPTIKNKNNPVEGVMVACQVLEYNPADSYRFLKEHISMGKGNEMLEVVPTSDEVTVWCNEEFLLVGGWENIPATDVVARFDKYQMMSQMGWALGGPVIITGGPDGMGEAKEIEPEVLHSLVLNMKMKYPDDVLGPYPARWMELK